ncbi:MAG: hypothetical protein EBZ75_12460 [Oxalobacteraceae bacterium]|nr:hypothetical protein [Oxalobacteraceae bacterium]
MSDLINIVRQSRVGLVSLATTIALGALVVWGTRSFEQNVRLELSAVQAKETAENAKLESRDAEMALLKASFTKFEALRGSGLAGNADREAWVESLLKVHKSKDLPDTLSYSLLAPVPLPGAEPSPTIAPALTHDMTLTLDSIHEGELLDLLNSYEQQVKGKFRVQSCQLSSPSSKGLTASCLLRFFNQPLTPPPVAASS